MSGPTARLPWWRRWFGTRSERVAARYLQRRGYRIVARNYTCPHGELDLVAVQGRCVVFVEVRSTESDDAERPAASVDRTKQTKLTQVALHFLRAKGLLGCSARFDVLTLHTPAGAREPEVTHYPQAFEAVGRFQMHS